MAEETIDGVHFIRAGRQWSVHWHAFRHYYRNLSQNFDVVVDEINTIPFFTPLWFDKPIVMFIHQLAREVWWYEARFPLSLIGYVSESFYLRLYRQMPVLTVSASTRADLLHLQFSGPITVVPQGMEPIREPRGARAQSPTFLYVGRLAPSKRVADVIRAFSIFGRSIEGAELRLIGEGPPTYVRKLRSIARELGVSERLRFLGRVSVHDKQREMAAAHMLLLASAREGWGLVVTEANAFGTPAVAYDVPGLRDSIRNEQTGLLVQASPERMAAAVISLWNNAERYENLSAAASAWSSTFSFERTATVVREFLTRVCESRPAAQPHA